MTSPRINLLPAEQRPDRRAAAWTYGWAAGAVLAVCVAGLHYYGLVRERDDLLARTRTLEEERGRLRGALQQAQKLREREERVAQAEGHLRSLRGRSWWPVLVEFASLTPPGGVSWEMVEGGEGRIRIQGTGKSVAEVAALVTGLVASPNVEGVDLHYVNEKAPGRFEFALTVRLLAGEGR